MTACELGLVLVSALLHSWWSVAIKGSRDPLAFNLLHFFYDRNLKPAVRRRASLQHIGREITAELYAAAPNPHARAPP